MKTNSSQKNQTKLVGVLSVSCLLATISFAASETDNSIEATNIDDQIKSALLSKANLEKRIDELNDLHKAYDLELSQSHQDLGATLQTLDLHKEAVESYSIALQSERINKGLNNLNQLPILTKLIISNHALADWKAADTNTQLYYHIAKNNYDPGESQRFEAFVYFARWKIYAAKQKYLSEYSAAETLELYKNEIRMISELENYELKNQQLATLYLDHAEAEFYLASQVMQKPLKEYQQGADRSTTSRLHCYQVRDREGNIVQICERIEEPNLDYYINPSNEKKREVGRHLAEMQEQVTKAFLLLQDESIEFEIRAPLLNQAQRLTNDYNAFVREHSN